MSECTCGYHGTIGSALDVEDPRWSLLLACPASTLPQKTVEELRDHVAKRDALFAVCKGLNEALYSLRKDPLRDTVLSDAAIKFIEEAMDAVRSEISQKDDPFGRAA